MNKTVLNYLESIGVTARISPTAAQTCRYDCKPTFFQKRKIEHNHGYEYRIAFTRADKMLNLSGFWNSIFSRYDTLPINVEVKLGSIKATPTVYDMLCRYILSAYVNQQTFAEYCFDRGLNDDSKRAEGWYKQECEDAIKLQRFFTAEELTKLGEICQ